MSPSQIALTAPPFAIEPRAAGVLGALAARCVQALRRVRIPANRGDLDMSCGEILALAERYDQSQPDFANDLRAAVAASRHPGQPW